MPAIASLIKIRLPTCPPSTNRAWRTFRGRAVKSPEGRSWEEEAILRIKAQTQGARLPNPGYWQAQFFMPRQSRIDLDNLMKMPMDALHRAGVTPDDRHLVQLRASFWAGDYLIIYVKHERLEKWQTAMKPSKDMAKKMRAASTSIPSP